MTAKEQYREARAFIQAYEIYSKRDLQWEVVAQVSKVDSWGGSKVAEDNLIQVMSAALYFHALREAKK